MREGTASHTARSVAAHRLDYTRAAAAHGDPAADEALTRDVAAGLAPKAGPMHEYLRGRTDFFDRAVTDALGRGVRQVVIGGAGYDGRALRYAGPGVHWFEVDHPATQGDKRERLGRLGLDARSVRFIAADFTADPVAGPLLEAGLDSARDTLVLLEGVAVYLDLPVLERVLGEFRRAGPAGSTLAISVSVHAPHPGTRVRFQQRAVAVGEPARTVLTAEQATGVLAAAGWEVRPGSGRQRSAGLLLARAALAAALPAPRPPARPRRTRTGPASRCPPCCPRPSPRSRSRPTTRPSTACRTAPPATAARMRHLPDEGIMLAELRARARTETNLDGMRRWGYVTFTPPPARGRRPQPDALVRPTAWGRAARQTWPEATEATETRWRDRLGPGRSCRCGRCCPGRCLPSRCSTSANPARRSRSAPTSCARRPSPGCRPRTFPRWAASPGKRRLREPARRGAAAWPAERGTRPRGRPLPAGPPDGRRVPGPGRVPRPGRPRPGGLAHPVRRRPGHRAPPGAGTPGRWRPALPDDPAPRRLSRRQLTAAAGGRWARKVWRGPACGYSSTEEVLSMRLGKEQAAGYVEDIWADVPVAEESSASQSERISPAPVTEPAVPVA